MSGRALAAALALALGASAVAGPGEGAPARVRIGLERLQTSGVDPALVGLVEERVCAAIGQQPGVEVICPADVAAAALLARNAAVFGECQADDCMKRVDAVKAADQRVIGSVEKTEKGIVLSLRLTRPSGEGPPVVEKLPGDVDALLGKIPGVVKKLFP